MSDDLYARLGVMRDASPEIIKAAYRAKVKRAHPDAGGSAEEFAAISEAWRVLSDPETRAEYDRTGHYDAGAVDNLDVQALNMVAHIVMTACADDDFSIDVDFVAHASQSLRFAEREVDKVLAAGERALANLKRMKARLDAKSPEAKLRQDGFLEGIRTSIERSKAGHEEKQRIVRRAIVILDEWRWLPAQSYYYGATLDQYAALLRQARRGGTGELREGDTLPF